jgi:uncharacterized protein (DUF736 family)
VKEREAMMIGKCQKDEEDAGYSGNFATLMMRSKFRLEPREKGADYALIGADGAEWGAGWRKSGEWGPYISLRIDCPTLPGPISATMKLTPSEDGWYVLRWNRRSENGHADKTETQPDRQD